MLGLVSLASYSSMWTTSCVMFSLILCLARAFEMWSLPRPSWEELNLGYFVSKHGVNVAVLKQTVLLSPLDTLTSPHDCYKDTLLHLLFLYIRVLGDNRLHLGGIFSFSEIPAHLRWFENVTRASICMGRLNGKIYWVRSIKSTQSCAT